MMDKSLDQLKIAFNALLDIPNIEVDEVEIDREGDYRVTIHSTEHGTCCHQCGNFIVRSKVKTTGFSRSDLSFKPFARVGKRDGLSIR